MIVELERRGLISRVPTPTPDDSSCCCRQRNYPRCNRSKPLRQGTSRTSRMSPTRCLESFFRHCFRKHQQQGRRVKRQHIPIRLRFDHARQDFRRITAPRTPAVPMTSRRAPRQTPTRHCAYQRSCRVPARGSCRPACRGSRRPVSSPASSRLATASCRARLPPAPGAFAKPKSSTFTTPSGRSLTLAGFRSRWMIPLARARLRGLPRSASRSGAPRQRESHPARSGRPASAPRPVP